MIKKIAIILCACICAQTKLIGAGESDTYYADGPDQGYRYYVAAREITDIIITLATEQELKLDSDFCAVPIEERIQVGGRKTCQGMDLWFSNQQSLLPCTIIAPFGEYKVLDKPENMSWSEMKRFLAKWKTINKELRERLDGTIITYTGLLTAERPAPGKIRHFESPAIHMELGCDTERRQLPPVISFNAKRESKKISAALAARYKQEESEKLTLSEKI